MFKKIKAQIAWLEDKIVADEGGYRYLEKDDVVECEKCGCLLRKETAIRGDSRIKEIANYESMEYILPCDKDGIPIIPTKEVMHKNYYCKVHAPKKTKIK